MVYPSRWVRWPRCPFSLSEQSKASGGQIFLSPSVAKSTSVLYARSGLRKSIMRYHLICTLLRYPDITAYCIRSRVTAASSEMIT